MAKSTRSKVKRAYRAKKRETGVYAAAEAARLQKLNDRLARVISSEKGKDNIPVEEPGKDDAVAADLIPINTPHLPKVSTHGPRNSRREEWRKSKGMPARRARTGTTWEVRSRRKRH
ncbi:hypothetical protein F5887DRAFT_893729 [Amanita rubescens]|nr:hypothetical protein F5887DRAFT_893729 [Amanita rubescens]